MSYKTQYFGADGTIPSSAPRETGLQPVIMRDETGVITGVQGGSLSLEASMPLIKSFREQADLMKSRSVKTKRPIVIKSQSLMSKPRIMAKSMGNSVRSSFSGLLAELDNMQKSYSR